MRKLFSDALKLQRIGVIFCLLSAVIVFGCQKKDEGTSPSEPDPANTATATPTATATAIMYHTFDVSGDVSGWSTSQATSNINYSTAQYVSAPGSMSAVLDTSSETKGYLIYDFGQQVDMTGNVISISVYLPQEMEDYDISILVFDGSSSGAQGAGTANNTDSWQTFFWDLGSSPPSGIDLTTITSAMIRISINTGAPCSDTIYVDNVDFDN